MTSRQYNRNVFINCPFDKEYAPLFYAIVFATQDLGFRPRCARERMDSGEVRLDKIAELIAGSRYSIHDLSRTELDSSSRLPRFNMPLELGIDIGCRLFGKGQRQKSMLILDVEKFRYQKYVSDISGQDIQSHSGKPLNAVIAVRHWLRTASGVSLQGGAAVFDRYRRFRRNLPAICRTLKLDADELAFADLSFTIATWLREYA